VEPNIYQDGRIDFLCSTSSPISGHFQDIVLVTRLEVQTQDDANTHCVRTSLSNNVHRGDWSVTWVSNLGCPGYTQVTGT
jgi:hypothetical protein